MKTPSKHRKLGLLDLYGFEPLGDSIGGFEQLVFNFAAEKVQRVTIEWSLVSEQQEYNLEGVEWTNLDFVDNGQVVSILERGSYGILSILEEVCMSAHNFVMAPPTTVVNANRDCDGNESGSSTPSLTTVSPDDVFLERIAERFTNHSLVEVRLPGGGYSSNTTPPATSEHIGGDCSTPEKTNQSNNKEDNNNRKLPHHCFK